MKKILSMALLGAVLLTTAVSADANKGKKLYMKKLKASCGVSGSVFARKHTQDEWQAAYQAGRFGDEVKSICPKATLKPKYEKDIYHFSWEYAKDSGNVPSC